MKHKTMKLFTGIAILILLSVTFSYSYDNGDYAKAIKKARDLRDANLSHANLTGRDLYGADLTNSKLNDSILCRAD
ncbi:MAG TPA: pentapeptide repeat-containing protein, partial [Spirochaetota bacterium]|nr:pentapeptide repeat-containing protein [Spirochaetota bacterium]